MINFAIRLVGIYLNTLNLFFSKLGGKHAFYIFCYPFKAKINKRQQAYLDTADQFKLPIDDFEIQCYKWGEGPRKVLFVHGWQSNTYRWKNFIETLPKEEFTLYSFDAPGHGNSGSFFGNVPLYDKSISKIINHIGNAETIIAHSIGSFSALYSINTNPENKPTKMVSLASPDSAGDFINFYVEKLKLNERTIKNLEAYFNHYTTKDIADFSLEKIFTNKNPKGLIIHDKQDKVCTVEYAKKMHNLWPQSELVLTEGHGHKLNDAKVIGMVKEFVVS